MIYSLRSLSCDSNHRTSLQTINQDIRYNCIIWLCHGTAKWCLDHHNRRYNEYGRDIVPYQRPPMTTPTILILNRSCCEIYFTFTKRDILQSRGAHLYLAQPADSLFVDVVLQVRAQDFMVKGHIYCRPEA